MTFKHREAWLQDVVKRLRPGFKRYGHEIPAAVRVSCGFPSVRGLGTKKRRLGECWSDTSSADGHIEIMVSPTLADPVRVVGVLTHELIHAAVGLKAGHGPLFRELATNLGLEGKMTATEEGELFKRYVAPIIEAAGPYPHAELTGGQSSGPKKQSIRMLKATCPEDECGYTVRITRKWLDACGAPICPVHETQMEEV